MAAEKGMWFKDNMYDAAARVPLIIRMPDVIRAASKYDSLISHVYYFPTIMGLANISSNLPENQSDGRAEELHRLFRIEPDFYQTDA